MPLITNVRISLAVNSIKSVVLVALAVRNQGIGIPEESLQKIFDPFFTTKHDGNGLGLATSYSIVKKHDGHITADSEVGVGTTFHIYLPASPEEFLAAEEKEEAAPIKGEGRILVMDDEEPLCEAMTKIGEFLGYEVVTAADGAEAIEQYKNALESEPFDAVIMDLTIPGGMGGNEAIQKLKEIDSEVKAIVSSGYSNDPIMSDFRKYGFMDVIIKPYEVQRLSEVLHEVIANVQDGT